MPKTPFRTPNDPLIVTPGDLIRGEDATVGTAVLVRGGDSTAGNNVGGTLTLQGGAGVGTGAGGAAALSAGAPGVDGAGADVSILATNSSAASGVGGAISLTAGDSTGVANAGNITLTPGIAGGTGADGLVLIGNSTGLQFTETATVPGPAILGAQGRVWLRSDSPNVLMFTDDAGTDWVLNSSGGTPIEAGTPLNNLVAYVDIGDPSSYPGTGTTVTDFQGNLTGGTISGNTTYATGALDFEGTTGALTFTKNASVDNVFSGGGTIMVFFRARSDGEVSQGELLNTGFPTGGYNLITENELAGDGGSVRLTFQRDFDGNNGIWDFLGVNDINVRFALLDAWNSIAIVYDDTSTANVPRPYLNGKIIPDAQIQITQAPTGSAVTDAGNSLIIGNRGADDRTYDGDFDVLLAFDTALTTEEIATAHTIFAQRHGQHTAVGSTVRKGGDLFMYAGDYVGTGADNGGAVFIRGGTTWSDNNSSEGGQVEIRGGNSQNTLAGTGGGGALGNVIVVGGAGDQESNTRTVGDLSSIASEFGGGQMTAGNGPARTLMRGTDSLDTSAGGDLIVRAGDCIGGSGNDAGGDLALTSGRGRNIQGGNILIRSRGTSGTGSTTGAIYISTQQSNDPFAILGAQGGSGTDSGNITITTGPIGATANTSGDISISTGSTSAVTGNDPGSISITGGSNTIANNFVFGGQITLTAGDGNATTSGGGGSVNLTAGDNNTTGSPALSGVAGSVNLTAGNMNGTGSDAFAGSVNITAGDGVGTNTNGGSVIVTGGAGTGTEDGGSITLTPGVAGGTGVDGEVTINGKLNVTGGIDPTYLGLNEQVSFPTSAMAGIGYLWVRNDVPNVLVYTDDTGTDFDVAGASVGGAPLSSVLVAGNTTGGTDIEITSGDSILGQNGSTGGSIPITAGDATVDGNPGGSVTIMGGTTTALSTGAGGSVTVQGRTPASNNGTGGAVTVAAGDGGTGGGNADGGAVTITAGDGKVSAQGGAVSITAGLSLGAVVTGGPVDITGGANQTPSGTGGVVTLLGGTGERTGGPIVIKGGTKNASGAGFSSGDVTIESGDINGTSGFDFGDIFIRVPDPVTPSTDNILGGNITIKAGTTGTRNADGGDVTITAGDTFGFNTRIGGSIFLNGGDENNGAAASDGGLIVMTPGTSVSGEDGRVQILGPATMEFLERSAVTGTPAAGRGYIWLRNDTPNVLMFTDDGGTDYVIGGTGVPAATLQASYEAGNTITTDATNGAFDVSGTQAISLDASLASNFTVAGADLTLSTTTSGTLALTSAGVVDIDSGASGDIEITAGAGTSAGGGSVELTAGAGAATFAGGAFTVVTGLGGSGAPGGAATITMGAGGTDGGDAGSFSFLGAPGAAGTTGAGGGGSDIGFSSGAGGDGASGFGGGAGGDWGVLLGAGGDGAGAGAGGVGGGATFTLGTGGAAGTTLDGGAGGSFTFTAGAGGPTTAGTGGAGGSIGFATGDGGAPGGGTGGDAGSFGIVLGTPAAGGSPGTFDVIGGDASFSGSVSIGGKLTVTGMIDPPGLTMSESASNPGAVAPGDGTLWVRSDTPNTLVFTDDGGTDFVVAGALGITTLQSAYEGGNTITTDSTNGAFDVSGTEAISLDASVASNFTVAGAALSLGTTTSGAVDLTSAGTVLVTGSGTVTVEGVSGSAANVLINGGSGTASAGGVVGITGGAGDGNFAGGEAVVQGGTGGTGGASGAGGSASITGGAAGAASGAAGGDANVTPGAGDGAGVDGSVNIGQANTNNTLIGATNEIDLTSGSVDVNATGVVTIDGGGAISVNSSGGAISIGNNDIDQAINVGTAGERQITIGSNVAGETTGVAINTGTGDFTVSAGTANPSIGGAILMQSKGALSNITAVQGGLDGSSPVLTLQTTGSSADLQINAGRTVDVNATSAITMDAAAASNFTVAGAGLTLSTTTSGTLAVSSAGILDLDSGTASAVTINSGVGSTSAGGAVTVTSGAGDGANNGGAITVVAGDSGAGATGNGGTITITAGDAASTNGDGGDIVLNPGALSGTGAAGEVTINGKLNVTGGIDPTYLGLNEQASFPTTALAGIGYLWVQNDTPSSLIYTDDAGTDFPLAGAAFSRNGGTALVAGDFSLSAGWGSTATVSSITGTDSRFLIEISPSGTGFAANPTITLTYTDGAWPNAPFPQLTDNGSVDGAGGYLAPVFELTSRTTTQAVWTLRSSGTGSAYTPVGGETFKMIVVVTP